ncbi:MAG: hypothetical protein K1W37_23245 [Lachnospiraceae bacterium]|jgi:hypothetical protein
MGMRKIYWQIARENGVIVKEVRDGMQEAVNAAYQNPPKDRGVTSAFQERIPCRGEIPTPEEVIRFAAGEIQKKRVKQ